MKLLINFKHLIPLFIVLSSCAIRTDGIMNVRNRPVGMVYFKTNNANYIFDKLTQDFGQYKKGDYPYEYWWSDIKKNEWSGELLEMKVLRTRISGYEKETISVAIIDKSNNVLSDENSLTIKEIKKYFKRLKTESEKQK